MMKILTVLALLLIIATVAATAFIVFRFDSALVRIIAIIGEMIIIAIIVNVYMWGWSEIEERRRGR